MERSNLEHPYTIREALLSMAYREVKPGRWAKPVGLHLFTFDEKALTWDNWFHPANCETSGKDYFLWESKILTAPFHPSDLMEAEAYTRVNVGGGHHHYPEFWLRAIDI